MSEKEETPEKSNESSIPKKEEKEIATKKIPLEELNTNVQYSKQNHVLVVHGQDSFLKKEVIAVLTQLELEPIISQSRTNIFKPLVEKSIEFKNTKFAVIILFGDHLVYPKDKNPSDAVLRAHQMVIFELGFWIGKLGRDRVFVLYQEKKRFRRPTEYYDVIYTPLDDKRLWKKELFDRLKNSGYKVDGKKLEI